MTTDRIFAAFARDGRHGLGVSEVPADGFCISSFVVLSDQSSPGLILMGRLSPDAAWDHIGALDRERAEINSRGWMLPSSHLVYGESPGEAALRIAQEQLGVRDLALGEPRVFSEVYGSKHHPEKRRHWDLEFVYTTPVDPASISLEHPAWRELRFVDANRLDPAEVSRSHEDIIARIL